MKNELTNRNSFYPDYDFFDEAMHDFFPSFYGKGRHQKYMRTDIKETDDAYQMEVELPGLDKQDIHIDLKDGYLNISASKNEKKDGDKKDNYIHRERSFSCTQLLRRGYPQRGYQGEVRKRHPERYDPEGNAEEGRRAQDRDRMIFPREGRGIVPALFILFLRICSRLFSGICARGISFHKK